MRLPVIILKTMIKALKEIILAVHNIALKINITIE